MNREIDLDKDVKLAETVEVKAEQAEAVATESAELEPVQISESASLSENPDFENPMERVKALFVQIGTDYSNVMRTQMDSVDGKLTLTSFAHPTLQFLYTPELQVVSEQDKAEVQSTIFVAGFPADDAMGVLTIVMDLQRRAHKMGMNVNIGGVIAPVQTDNGTHVLVADPDQVNAIAARTMFLQGRATLKMINDAIAAKEAAKEAEKAAALEKTEIIKEEAKESNLPKDPSPESSESLPA